MAKLKKSTTPSTSSASTPEEQQLAKARSRKSQAASQKAAPAAESSPQTETAITPAQPTAVAQVKDEQEELKTESVQQQTQVQGDLEAARRLGVQLALAERQNDEVAFSAYQQTKELIEEELGAAPQIFRRYNGFQPIDLNAIATEQFDAAGLQFSANADLSALAERLLKPQDSAQNPVA